jgi:hypothetical protein
MRDLGVPGFVRNSAVSAHDPPVEEVETSEFKIRFSEGFEANSTGTPHCEVERVGPYLPGRCPDINKITH